MWAQILKTRMKPGLEREIAELRGPMRKRISGRQGLIHSFWLQSQHDPLEYYTFIVFESEDMARAGEQDLEIDPFFKRVRALADGPPEYVDLTVLDVIPSAEDQVRDD